MLSRTKVVPRHIEAYVGHIHRVAATISWNHWEVIATHRPMKHYSVQQCCTITIDEREGGRESERE